MIAKVRVALFRHIEPFQSISQRNSPVGAGKCMIDSTAILCELAQELERSTVVEQFVDEEARVYSKTQRLTWMRRPMSVIGGKADIARTCQYVRCGAVQMQPLHEVTVRSGGQA